MHYLIETLENEWSIQKMDGLISISISWIQLLKLHMFNFHQIFFFCVR